jgi:nicotinate-nucleotide adenylyltransferase
MNKIGLYFGTFNPIHIGHLLIAEYFVEHTDLKEVWFVVSPQNPLKDKKTILSDHHRLALVKLAIDDNAKFRVTDIEYKMPKPSYTVRTLAYLTEKYPEKKFVLLMGSDNLLTFNKWKNYETILQYNEIYVYPRPAAAEDKLPKYPNVKITNAPLIELSSTFIRNSIKAKKSVKYFLPDKVYNYIQEMHFYEK